jgi:hypothetical protein
MWISHGTPRIHLLLFYLDSASCNGLVNKVTGYGLHSQGLVLGRSREFVLCQQMDCPWGPPWVVVDHGPESGDKIRVRRALLPWPVYAFIHCLAL